MTDAASGWRNNLGRITERMRYTKETKPQRYQDLKLSLLCLCFIHHCIIVAASFAFFRHLVD